MESSSPAHGFTLIEIIVSVTLLLVLSGLFMANYNSFNSSQTVKQAASALVSNLQAVRTKAASGVKPAGCGLTDPLVGYVVNFWNLPAPSGYSAQALCQSGPVGEISTYTLPTGVTFSSVPASVTFYALNRGASANRSITLTGLGTTTTVIVNVYTSGIVSD